MYKVTGLLLLVGVAYGARAWKDDFARLMLTIFGFHFLFFTFFIEDLDTIRPHSGEFWWADVAMIPAIVLLSHMLLDLRARHSWLRRVFWVLPVYLVLNAAFFVASTKNGPVLRLLDMTYEEVVGRVPFLF